MAEIGHNIDPGVQAQLAVDFRKMTDRTDELADGFLNMPEEITSTAEEEYATDFVKQLQSQWTSGDAARKAEKQPYYLNGQLVDGFFKKKIMDPVLAAKQIVLDRLDAFKEKREEAEREERLAAERKARAEAEEAQRVAEEAQRKAEAEAAEAKRIADDAEAKLVAEREERAAEERARENAITDDADAEAAEADRIVREAAQREEDKKAEDEAAITKENADIAKAEADEEAAVSKATADKAVEEAHKATRAASAPSADLTRARGDHGGVSSFRAEWTADITDFDLLDFRKLRHFFKRSEVEDAVRRFGKAAEGKADLAGAHIYQKKRTRVV